MKNFFRNCVEVIEYAQFFIYGWLLILLVGVVVSVFS